MEFTLVTPKRTAGLPQQDSYLRCGNPHTLNVRLGQKDGVYTIAKCRGSVAVETVETVDFQSALFHAHRLWNK